MITKMDRFLYLVPALTFAMLAGIMNVSCHNHGVCSTKVCLDISERLNKSMNTTVDPCDDFEEYACGKFFRDTAIPHYLHSVFMAQSRQTYKTGVNSKNLLLESPTKASQFKTDALSRVYYQSCMDEKTIERNGLKETKELFKKIGGFPAIEGASWNGQGFNWPNIVSKLAGLGLQYDFMMDFSVSVDIKNTTSTAIHFDNPGWLGDNPKELAKGFQSKHVPKYYNYMVEAAKLLGANNETAHSDMNEALLFEIGLAKISVPWDDRLNQTKYYHKRTIKDLEGQPGYPSPLKDFIKNFFYLAGVPGINVGDDDEVIVRNPEYFPKLAQLVKRTSNRTIANYLCWRVYHTFNDALGSQSRSLRNKYLWEVKGYGNPYRWGTCALRAGVMTKGEMLSLAVGSLYVRHFLNATAKQPAEDMATNIKSAFKDSLKQNVWMDEKTRKHAIDKVDAMGMTMGYPNEILDPAELDKYFKGLKVTNGSFLQNFLAVQKFRLKRSLENIKKPVDRHHFSWHQWILVTANRYQTWSNYFEFPAAVLQDKLYNPELPMFMNYGAIGARIASKLTNGFDAKGSQFDKDGNLNNWWEKEAHKKFNQKVKCVIDQYGKFKSIQANRTINGTRTQNTNIADIGGARIAYAAYKKYVNANGPEKAIPGYNLTSEQLFFVSYAQGICGKYTTKRLKLLIDTGVEPPSKFRILGSLSNNPDFTKAFQCRLGSRMNPQKKCNVW